MSCASASTRCGWATRPTGARCRARIRSRPPQAPRAPPWWFWGRASAAVRPLFAPIQNAPASALVHELLAKLLKQEPLPAYLDGLRSPSTPVADAAAKALASASTYDATQLLALYADDNVSRARLELILDSQHTNLQPNTLLKVLPDLGKEARNSAFRLLDRV